MKQLRCGCEKDIFVNRKMLVYPCCERLNAKVYLHFEIQGRDKTSVWPSSQTQQQVPSDDPLYQSMVDGIKEKGTKRLLTMDAESQPLLTSRTQNQIRLRHLWFFLVAGLVVIVVAYCAFVNKIFLLRALECPFNILNKCDTDIENSRWVQCGKNKKNNFNLDNLTLCWLWLAW